MRSGLVLFLCFASGVVGAVLVNQPKQPTAQGEKAVWECTENKKKEQGLPDWKGAGGHILEECTEEVYND